MNPRSDARAIFAAALASADPREAVRKALRAVNARRIWLVGAGKAAAAMAEAAEEVLGDRIAGGAINVKHGYSLRLRRCSVTECGHPVPDAAGVEGARKILDICNKADDGDLVLCLISGGASALMPLPAAPVTLEEKQETTRLLLASGATIHEMNAVRKHLSAIKGGQLARAAAPSRVLSLILSDVVGDDLDVIGSGPTAPDLSTFESARSVLDKYGIANQVPAAVRSRLSEAAFETPKPGDPLFERVENRIIGSNRTALAAAATEAAKLGYRPVLLTSRLEGEAKEAARVLTAIARDAQPPACLISGGEPTVTLGEQHGKGGRNQEFTLSAAIALAGVSGVVVLSAGTDGSDGPTDAAGAIADGDTVQRGPECGGTPAGARCLSLLRASERSRDDRTHGHQRDGRAVIPGDGKQR